MLLKRDALLTMVLEEVNRQKVALDQVVLMEVLEDTVLLSMDQMNFVQIFLLSHTRLLNKLKLKDLPAVAHILTL
jgi:hypothetical protein